MTDLPTLTVGCGEKVESEYGEENDFTCGDKNEGLYQENMPVFLCGDCDAVKRKVLPVLKAHARSHHNEQDKEAPKGVIANKCFQCYVHEKNRFPHQTDEKGICCCPACIIMLRIAPQLKLEED